MRGSLAAAAVGALLLGGCGGSGGTVSTPAPALAPDPPPAAAPSPVPTPAATFTSTSEYARSSGPAQHGAVTPWTQGISGQGVTIGIIDSGIDSDSPEFAGRLSPASTDVVANRGLDNADSDHGTNVALIAAAARDNLGIMGIAFQSTIAMFRTDTVGTCADPDPDAGCTFNDNNIAVSLDRAVAAGAKVINLSLGGGAANFAVTNAIERAASAGVVIIVSAGNDGDSTKTDVDPANPDPFATALRRAGNGNVIIAGSVDKDNAFSVFSNRAGSEAGWFLAARGERVCCVYENGALKIEINPDGSRSQFVISGTSFAAPQIAGAVALLRQAFPNLTATEVVDLLLRTASDGGAAGTDSTFGRGVLNITAAFAPVGTTALASTAVPIVAGASTVTTSPPMGDAARLGAGLPAVVLDSYHRAYELDLAAGVRGAPIYPRLAAALAHGNRQVGLTGTATSLAFSIDGRGTLKAMPWTGPLRLTQGDAQQAEVLAGQVISRLAPGTVLAFGYRQGSDGLTAQLQGLRRPAFLIAQSPQGETGLRQRDEVGLAIRHALGPWGVTMAGTRGSGVDAEPDNSVLPQLPGWREQRIDRIGVSFDRRFGTVQTAIGASWLGEERSVLGARLHDALGPRGADSLFIDAGAAWQNGRGWHLGVAVRGGVTRPRTGSIIAVGSQFVTSAWAFDAGRAGVFKPGDSLMVRISQPLRVEQGGLRLNLPVAYSYETLTATQGIRTLSLTPQGREIATELAWRGPLWGGAGLVSLFYRRDPGNYAELPGDAGLAVNWERAF